MKYSDMSHYQDFVKYLEANGIHSCIPQAGKTMVQHHFESWVLDEKELILMKRNSGPDNGIGYRYCFDFGKHEYGELTCPKQLINRLKSLITSCVVDYEFNEETGKTRDVTYRNIKRMLKTMYTHNPKDPLNPQKHMGYTLAKAYYLYLLEAPTSTKPPHRDINSIMDDFWVSQYDDQISKLVEKAYDFQLGQTVKMLQPKAV